MCVFMMSRFKFALVWGFLSWVILSSGGGVVKSMFLFSVRLLAALMSMILVLLVILTTVRAFLQTLCVELRVTNKPLF